MRTLKASFNGGKFAPFGYASRSKVYLTSNVARLLLQAAKNIQNENALRSHYKRV